VSKFRLVAILSAFVVSAISASRSASAADFTDQLALDADAAQEKVRADRKEDPLPTGVIARLGSLDFRHGLSLDNIALSPDGKTLVTVASSADSRWGGDEIRLWDLKTGKVIRSLSHRWTLRAVFSADGSKLATCGMNGVCLWDPANGMRLWTYPCDSFSTPFCLAFSADGKQLVIGTRGLELIDVATGKRRRVIEQKPAKTIGAVAFSPDGTMVAAPENRSVRLWDARTGDVIRTMEGEAWANGIAFSPDGKRMIAAGFKYVYIWETATGKLLQKLEGHADQISTLAMSRTGKYLATGGGCRAANERPHVDHSILIWDLAAGKLLRTLPGFAHDISGLCFTPDEKTLISADAAVRFWDVATGKQFRVRDGHEDEIEALRFDRDGKKLITVGLDRTARIWDARTGAQLHVNTLGNRRLDYLALSSAGTLACGSSRNGEDAFVYETATGNELAKFPAPQTFSFAFSTPGDRLFLIGRPVRYFDFKKAAVVKTPVGSNGWYDPIDVTGRFLMTQGEPGHGMILMDLVRGAAYHRIAGGSSHRAFSPDGRTVFAQRDEEGLTLWEIASGQIRAVTGLRAGSEWLPAVWSPDGRRAVLPREGELQVWDFSTNRAVATLSALREMLRHSCWSDDGRLLAAATDHGTVLVWDLEAMAPDKSKGKAPTAVTPKRLAAHWQDLASPDAAVAYRAIWELRDAGPAVIPPLLEQLRQVPVPDYRAIDQLLGDLGSDVFKRRDKATRELEKLGPAIVRRLDVAIQSNVTLEMMRRLESLHRKAIGPTGVPEILRVMRCIEVLENLPEPEARRALAALAKGPAEHFVTEEAQRALHRLEQWELRK